VASRVFKHEDSVVRLEGVARDFYDGRQVRRVLHPLDLSIRRGEFTIVSGPSGSGKTTLMTIMALILRPTEGKVRIGGRDVTSISEDEQATLRFRHFGFVFQNSALIPALTVLENVLIAAAVQGGSVTPDIRRRARASLAALGMGDFVATKVGKLSGGQKQRVAIARALVNNPPLLLCDEPTSALAVESGMAVLQTLKELTHEGRAVVLVTHDPRVFPYADRLIQLENGRVVTDTGAEKKNAG
jgi:putative ABC transport system ATP-binding protein